MSMRRFFVRWLGLAAAVWFGSLTSPAVSQASDAQPGLAEAASARAETLGRPVRAAIFVKNRAGTELDQKLRPFEDLLIGRIQGAGIELISSEDTVTAINRFLREGDDRVRARLRSGDDADIDRLLNESSSALRLAQDMGADYVLVVSLADYGRRTQSYRNDELGIDRAAVTHQLRAAYKVLSIADGAAVLAGDVVARTKERLNNDVNELTLGDLMAEASGQIADRLAKSMRDDALPEPEAIPTSRFIVLATMQDLMVPEVIENDEGDLVLGANRYQIEALAVDVLINGSYVGTTGQVIEVPAGFHVMRLEREGFTPWERRLKLPEIGADEEPAFFQTALAMNERGLARFREMTAMFQELKEQHILTQAEAERIRSMAQMFRQSGLRVDLRHNSDVHVGWQRGMPAGGGAAGGGGGEAQGSALRSAWRRMFPAEDAADGASDGGEG